MKRLWKRILGYLIVLSVLVVPVYSISQDITSSINPFELVEWEVEAGRAVIIKAPMNGSILLLPTVFRAHINPDEEAEVQRVMGTYIKDKLIQYSYCEDGKAKAYLYEKEMGTYREIPLDKKELNKCVRCHTQFGKEVPKCIENKLESGKTKVKI